MECKFLTNGMAIQYYNFVKPCCIWKADDTWIQEHRLDRVDLVNWHNHKDLATAREQLAQGVWPKNCEDCEIIESNGRQDSVRLGGESAYHHFSEDELTLEIRPGSICNFACQTCWPFASTRVEQFYKQAGITHPSFNLKKNKFSSYDFLLPVARKLKTIIILGGEPFFDPDCLAFLDWVQANTSAELLTFTNGSKLDVDRLKSLNRKITLVFSLDAVGRAAEYIRFGTEWDTVYNNFNLAKKLPNVEVRINITTSAYNFYYFTELLDLFVDNWPDLITFGPAMEDIFSEQVVPYSLRAKIISRLEACAQRLEEASIESGQKSNAVNAVNSICAKLKSQNYNVDKHNEFKQYVAKMDRVKHVSFLDYCPEVAELLE
jgi:molybdenum cofactor biosynthesis enzyme MoaA